MIYSSAGIIHIETAKMMVTKFCAALSYTYRQFGVAGYYQKWSNVIEMVKNKRDVILVDDNVSHVEFKRVNSCFASCVITSYL